MTELYLIAHKVRGEPAFDIAQRMCEGDDPCQPNCGLYPECKGEDIWIIPTSGHRAYPWWYQELTQGFSIEDILTEIPMPEGLRDHYTTKAEETKNLIDLLGLIHKPLAPLPPLKRRL